MSQFEPDVRRATYLLPIRRVQFDPAEAAELARYFQMLGAAGCEVLVVDGSPAPVFAEHQRTWREVCRHVTVNPKYTYLNGKVNGVHTGVDLASHERIILADDDIRYTPSDITRMCQLLDEHEMVRPQNFLSPLPWWGRMEAARMLINRGVLRAGDYPGTCAFRRSTMLRVGHYDGDVLFDNEEIVRHFALHGVAINYAVDFFILKRPPRFEKWLEQRPRQAYEDFVMRAKTMLFMSLGPVALALGLTLSLRATLVFVLTVAFGALLLAWKGRRRDRAGRFFPARVLLSAPLWILERSLSVYWALYWRVRYGGYPFGARFLTKGTGRAWIAGGRAQSRELAGRGRGWREHQGNV